MKGMNKGKCFGEKINSVIDTLHLRYTKSHWKHDSGLQKDVSFKMCI